MGCLYSYCKLWKWRYDELCTVTTSSHTTSGYDPLPSDSDPPLPLPPTLRRRPIPMTGSRGRALGPRDPDDPDGGPSTSPRRTSLPRAIPVRPPEPLLEEIAGSPPGWNPLSWWGFRQLSKRTGLFRRKPAASPRRLASLSPGLATIAEESAEIAETSPDEASGTSNEAADSRQETGTEEDDSTNGASAPRNEYALGIWKD